MKPKFKTVWGPRLVLRAEADETGQQMVEFALTFTIFCALLIALVLFGSVFFSYASIVNAARDGSRHLMAHPLLPADPDTFETSDQETIWIITNSLPLLDWHNMTINIMPEPAYRVPGGYVAVEILYTMQLIDLNIPLVGGNSSIRLLGPVTLRALSRRSLD